MQLVLAARNGVITFRLSPCPEWLKRALDRTEYEIELRTWIELDSES
jgi:hypothetical protein